MNIRRACLVAATSLSLLASVVPGAAAQDADASPEPLPEHVLFVGNSHTERNNGLDWLVEHFVAADDPTLAFDGTKITEGGVTLEYHWQNGAREQLLEGDFDTVVLQGYLPGSETPTAEPFLEYARLFDEVVHDVGARTVFFMTWPVRKPMAFCSPRRTTREARRCRRSPAGPHPCWRARPSARERPPPGRRRSRRYQSRPSLALIKHTPSRQRAPPRP